PDRRRVAGSSPAMVTPGSIFSILCSGLRRFGRIGSATTAWSRFSAQTRIGGGNMTRFRLPIGLSLTVLLVIVLAASVSFPTAHGQSNRNATLATEADYQRALKELSNWGRWGADDEIGAANLITTAKRKQALALAKEARPISLAHDVAQEKAADTPNILERTIVAVSPTGSTDRYQYSGTYHGVAHSHLDALDCHMMVDGKGYNGRPMEDIAATGGCPKGNINALKDGVVTRGILFDATRLPGKATPQGWL